MTLHTTMKDDNMSEKAGKLNGEAKVLFEHLNQQRDQDKKEDRAWKLDHNDSSKDFRAEIKADIADIWRTMRDGFNKITDAIINKKPENIVDIKTVIGIAAFLLTIITFIGVSLGTTIMSIKNDGMIVHQQMYDSYSREKDIWLDMNNKLNDKMQKEIDRERTEEAVVLASVYTLTERLNNLKEVVDIKSTDRFTGSEGKMMQKQVDRIEERLTYLTKDTIDRKREDDATHNKEL